MKIVIYYSQTKSSDLRLRNGMSVLKHIKANNQNINFKQLNEDIKNYY